MAQKRINKNLVAFLTVMGILLSVTIVGIAVYQGAKRDPAEYERQAREFEEKKDYPRAIERFNKAYKESGNDVKYAVEASRVAYQSGEIVLSIQLLMSASIQDPSNKLVLESMLRRMWEMRDLQFSWKEMRDYADKLLNLDKDNVLALACKAAALRKLEAEDPDNIKKSEDALEAAIRLAPDNPEVASVASEAAMMNYMRDAAKNTPSRKLSDVQAEAWEKGLAILIPAAEKNLTNAGIVARAALTMGIAGKIEEGIELLRKAVAANPTNGEMHGTLGRFLLARVQRDRRDSKSIPPDEVEKQLAEARMELQKAVELEPALYPSYTDLARTELFLSDEAAKDEELVARRSDAALKILENAIDATNTLRSAAATLNAPGRPSLYLDAFNMAMEWYTGTKDVERQKSILARARAVFEKASAAYATWHVPPYMEALLNVADNNKVAAIQLLETANRRGGQNWLPAIEKLAMLYREEGQYGRALDYADQALRLYHETLRQPAPLVQYVNKAQILISLNRGQEALQFLTTLSPESLKDDRLVAIRSEALRQTGRASEARELLAASSENRGIRLQSARLAAIDKDFAKAEEILGKLIDDDPTDHAALRLYASVMISSDKREAGRQKLIALKSRLTGDDQRVVTALELTLGITNEEERDAKLIELIQQTPDPEARATDLFNFYSARGLYEKAAEPLIELEKARPNDKDVIDKLFMLALTRKEFQKAEGYAVKLGQLNADQCRGAMYRGRLEFARQDYSKAVLALRDAEGFLPADSDLKVLLSQALVLCQPPRLNEALDTLKAAVQINPVNFEAQKLLYLALNEKGDEQEAKKHLAIAAELNPDDPVIRERKQILDEEKDPQAGIASREKRRATKPDDLENLLRLGSLYEKTKDIEKAEKCYLDALSVAPRGYGAVRAAVLFYSQNRRMEEAQRLVAEYNKGGDPEEQVGGYMLLAYACEKVGDQAAAYDALKEAERTAGTIPDEAKKRKALTETGIQFAEFCYRLELTKEMIASFRRVLDNMDKSDVATVQRIRLRIMQGMFLTQRFGDVSEEIEAFLRDYPNDTRGLAERGRLQVARGLLPEARATYTQILEKSPEDGIALYMRGSVSVDLGQYQDGISDLLKVKRLQPEGFKLQHRIRLAQAYEANGEFDTAAAELRELIALDSTWREPVDRLVRLYQRTRRFDQARSLMREYIVKYPQLPQWHYQLGRVLLEEKEYSTAVEPLSKALELAGQVRVETTAPIAADLMFALIKANRNGEALKLYDGLVDKMKTAVVKSRAAEAQYRLGQADQALALMEQAARDGAAEGWAPLIRVARVATDVFPPEMASSLFKRIAESTPPVVEHGWNYQAAYAQVLLRLEKRAEALALIEPLLSKVPPTSRMYVGLLESKAEALLDDPAAQVRVYEQILMQDPTSVSAINNIAYLKADKLNEPQEALKYAERARQMTGPDANILDTLGWARFAAGDLAGAESALSDAVRMDPGNATAQYHMGRLLSKKSNYSKAREHFETALRLATDNKENELLKAIRKAISELP